MIRSVPYLLERIPPLPMAQPALDDALYVSGRLLQRNLERYIRSEVFDLGEAQSAALRETPRRQAERLFVSLLEAPEPLLGLSLSGGAGNSRRIWKRRQTARSSSSG